MGIFQNFISNLGGGGRSTGQQTAAPLDYAHSAAVNVNEHTAMQLSAVWSCVKLITETIASLPVVIYDVAPDGTRKINRSHALYRLLNGKLNKWQTRQEFFECILYQYVLQGNSYAVKQYNNAGDLIALVPLMTPQMEVGLQDNGDVLYQYTENAGVRVYGQQTIWHNKLFGNGVIGLSPLAHARNTVAVGQAAEYAVTKIYKNGGKPSGMLMIDKILTDKQRAKIKDNFAELAEGNSDRLFVLEADMRYEKVSLSPSDIELLASRRFQLEEICRFFGVPSVLVNDTNSGTTWGSGIGQIVQGFYKFNLRPYFERLEASMMCNLVDAKERHKIDIEFDVDALLEPSRAERIKSGREGTQGGLFTPNEWRKREGLPPIAGGDKLIVQKQMIPLENVDTPMSQARGHKSE